MLLTSGGDHYRLVQTCSLEDFPLVPIVLTSSGGHRSGPYASYCLVTFVQFRSTYNVHIKCDLDFWWITSSLRYLYLLVVITLDLL